MTINEFLRKLANGSVTQAELSDGAVHFLDLIESVDCTVAAGTDVWILNLADTVAKDVKPAREAVIAVFRGLAFYLLLGTVNASPTDYAERQWSAVLGAVREMYHHELRTRVLDQARRDRIPTEAAAKQARENIAFDLHFRDSARTS